MGTAEEPNRGRPDVAERQIRILVGISLSSLRVFAARASGMCCVAGESQAQQQAQHKL